MYFEDEKENMTETEAFDNLDLDMESDNKTVTWDDLLDDDADIDLSNVKKDDSTVDVGLLDSADEDLSLLSDDEVVDIRPQTGMPKRDAFDVFGGSGLPRDTYAQETQAGDTITPDLTNRRSARAQAAIDSGEDDDIYFEPRKAQKSSGFLPVLLGIMVAVIFIGGAVYLFMTYGKSVAGLDASSLLNGNKPQEEAPVLPDENADKPVIDINAPAETSVAGGEENKTEESKKEEQKLVTFAIQNGGRINPFVPPSGFDSSKYTTVSNYEILSPPEALPDPEVTEEVKKLMEITVTGILFDDVKPSAIVNVNNSDYYVQIGDKVDEYQVVAINSQYVAIKNGTNIYKAQVGESFSSKTPVSGMAQKQTSGKFAGARQYTSASDVEVSTKEEY